MYLFILKNKCMYVYLISLGSIYVRFYFSISCMISVHGLSHGSSSAFCLHAVRTFCFSIFLWFGSSWQWSNRPPKIPADLSCIWPVMFSARIATVLIERFPFPICTGIRHILYQACPDLSKYFPYRVVERLWLNVR